MGRSGRFTSRCLGPGALTVAVAAVAASVAVGACLMLVPAAVGGRSDCFPSWDELPTPAVQDAELVAVAADAVDDARAVGATPASIIARDTPSRPLLEHWDGSGWTVVPGVSFHGALSDVAAVGRADAWAVGSTRKGAALVEHWDGSSWRRVAVPWTAELTGVSATGADDAWAVGYDSAGAMVLHWDGSRWLRVSRRRKAALEDVVALSPTDVWAVGNDGETRLLAMHWNGARWRAFKMGPGLGNGMPASFHAVAAISSTDVWAVGGAHIVGLNGYDSDPVVRHWNGERWSPVRPPHPGEASLSTVTVAAGGQVWTAGVDIFPFATQNGAASFVTVKAGPQWQDTPTPQRLVNGLATDPSGAVWLVGFRGSGIDDNGNGFPIETVPLIERYSC